MLHRSKDTALARKFLYLIAILIMLAIAAAFAYRLFGVQILRTALVPTTKFEHQAEAAPSVYADPAMWFSRPGKADDPSRWTPTGYQPAAAPPAAVFFIDRKRSAVDVKEGSGRVRPCECPIINKKKTT